MSNPQSSGTTYQDLIRQALSGTRGDEQKKIAEVGVALVAKLLRKNHDYGSSALSPPLMAPHIKTRDALLCRMSDKVARIHSLASKSAEVEESLDDSVGDLGGYSILWFCVEE